MEVIHFKVPAAAYPRYRYSKEHVVPLLQRFRELSQKCNIADPFEIPAFEDVHIYAISDSCTDVISVDELTPKQISDINQIKLKCKDVEDFQKKCPDTAAAIYIAAYSKATEPDSNLFEYLGHCTVLIAENDKEIRAETPDLRTIDSRITTVQLRANVAKQMGFLLERILFQELTKRVRILYAFLEVDSAEGALATLDQDISNILKQKYDPGISLTASRSISENEKDVIHVHEAWCAARLSAIKKKICSEYGKKVPEVRNQLLDHTDMAGRTIRVLKICEQIFPYVCDGTVKSESDHIPKKFVDQMEVLQKSHEHIIKAQELEQRFKTHLDLVQSNRDELKQLYGESMSMYQRSMVPLYERPKQSQMKQGLLNEQVAKQFLGVKGVTGCGYRFCTLDVYVKDTMTNEERQIVDISVQNIAESHGISEFKIRTEQEEITKFAEYEVGSTLTSRLNRSASLGGFALKGKCEELSLLVARHFADDGKPVFVLDNNGKKSVFAHIISPANEIDRCATLDIAAGLVLQKERSKCLTMFKDHCGARLPSKLSLFENEAEIEWLKGLPVHIWGASSSPGLGKIIIPDFYVEGMKRLVKIEDRHPVETEKVKPFSKEGDSGSIVCADDPDGEQVHVVSMVTGSSNYTEKQNNPDIRGEYLSIRLKDGLLQLEEIHGDTFKLC